MSTPRTWLDNMGCFSFVGLVATFLLLLGDGYAQSTASWPIYRSDSNLSGRAKVEGPIIPDLFWVKQIGLEKIQSPVVTSDNTVIFTSRGDRFVYALDHDGSEKWRFSHKLPNGSFETFSHPPTLGIDGTIYVGSHESGFLALNPDGSLKWRAQIGGVVGLAPNIGKDGNIYLACDDTQIYVFTPSGTLVSVASLDGLMPGNTPAIVSNSQVYVPAGNSIFVFNAGLARIARWQFPALGDVAWVVSNANGSVLYAGSSTLPLVIALDAQSGRQIWSYAYDARFGSPSQPALGPDGTIYFAGFDAGLLVALQPNGKEKWTHDQGSARYKTMPVVDASGDIYIVNEALGLVAFAPNKTQLWNLPNVQCKYAPAFGPDGTIYVPSLKKLYAVRHQPPFAVRLEFVGGDSQTACIDSVLANPIVARVFDQYGKSFEGQPVRFRVVKGGGKPVDATVNTLGDGTASVQWQLGPELGQQELEISSLYNGQHLIGSPDTAIAFAVGPKIDGASEVVFDTTAVKEASEKTYTIFNRSDCILTVDSLVTKPPFFVISPIAKTTIAPNSSIVVRLQFAPTAPGNHVGILLVYSNDATDSLMQVTLRGEATTRPEIVADPTNLDFGEVLVGKDSTRLLKISNIGTASLIVDSIVSSDPAYSHDLANPITIPPGESSNVAVTFTPREGKQYLDTLTISSNDPRRPAVEVALSGRGKLEPKIDVSPLILDFGKVCLDSCLKKPITISNKGNDTLFVYSIKSADTIFTVDDKGDTLLPGESIEVPVAFCPKEARSYTGKLTIESNDPDDPSVMVELRGEGISPKIVLRPEPPSFEVCANEIVNGVLNIVNDSDCALRIDSISFAIVPTGLFALQTDNWQTTVAALVIPPRQSLPFAYSFQAPSKNFEVRFRVRSSGMPDPATLVVPGIIAPPTIAGDDSVKFGKVLVGNSKTEKARVWNAGKCDVRIDSVRIAGRDAFAFSIVNLQECRHEILHAGDSTCVAVEFHPKDEGEHTALLLVYSNDKSRSPLQIVLHGNGVNPVPIIEVSDANFGVVCDTSYQDVFVSNRGQRVLHVTDLIFDTPVFFTDHATVFEVAVGDSEKISVGFVFMVGQAVQGQMLVKSDATKRDSIAVLQGEGGAPDIASNNFAEFKLVTVQICNGKSNADTLIHFIKNDGTCALEITGLLTSAPFSVISPATPITIAPGASVPVTLAFTPQDSGSFTGVLRITSNDPVSTENPFDVMLSGKGVAQPDIDVPVAIIDFGEVCADSLKPVVVFNHGHDILRVTKLVFSNPAAFSTTHPVNFVIAPCDSETIWVRFKPTKGQADSGDLAIHSNDLDEAVVNVALKGKGGVPDIAGKPSPVVFPDVTLRECAPGGQDSSSATFEIRNSGKCDLVISSFNVDGAFALKPIVTPITLRENETITLILYFKPKTVSDSTGSLHVLSNDLDTPELVVSLRGKALAVPKIATQPPDTLRFSATTVGNTTDSVIVVSNIGSGILNVSRISITGTVFTTTTPTPFALTCSTTKNVVVWFKPTAEGAFREKLTLTSNDPATPEKVVWLIGNGTAPPPPDIDVRLLAINFGTLCAADSDTVFVSNVGASTLNVDTLIFTNRAFSTAHPLKFEIAPGATDTIIVVLDPAFSTSYDDALLIHSNDPDEPVVAVTLKGAGNAPPDIAGLNRVPFGDVEIQTCSGGRNSISIPYRVENTGSCSLTVVSLTVAFPFSVAPIELPFKVSAGGFRTVHLIFEPDTIGTFTRTLQIYSDDPNESPFPVTLTGRGVFLPDIHVRPDTLYFGSLFVGASSSLTDTITSKGKVPLTVSSFLFSNPAFSTLTTPSFSLACTEDSVITITFSPTREGAYVDSLIIVSNDPNEDSVVVQLRGNGLGNALLDVVPDTLDFGDVTVNEKKSKRLYLKSVGSTAVAITGCVTDPTVIFASEYCARTDDDRIPIPPGGIDSTTVEFAPNAEQLFIGTLTFQSNDASGRPVRVYLRGRGVKVELDVFPKPLEALAACVGVIDTIKGRIENTGSSNITIYPPLQLASQTAGQRDSTFRIIAPVLEKETTLAPGESLKVAIAFMAEVAGEFSDELLVRLESANAEPTRFAIKGEAREQGAHIDLDRTVVIFDGYLDEATREEKVKITNKGCERLTIDEVKLVHEKHFKITSDLSGVSLEPDSGVFATVIFKGDMFETTFTDTMLVYSNDRDMSDRSIAVKLTGQIGDGDQICVDIKPPAADFQEVPVDNERTITVELINCTNPASRLTLRPLALLKEKDAFSFSLEEKELFPNGTRELNVKFKPSAARLYLDTAYVEVWITGQPETRTTKAIPLSGTGTGVDEVTLRPNVVTPNGDDKNDEAVFMLPKDLKDVTLHIFDLRGLRVIVLDDRDNSKTIEWNGRDENKQIVLPGPYLWIIEAQGRKVKSGQIVVIR